MEDDPITWVGMLILTVLVAAMLAIGMWYVLDGLNSPLSTTTTTSIPPSTHP